MSRYIDADRLNKEVLASWEKDNHQTLAASLVHRQEHHHLMHIIEKQPTADVVEVVHGHNVGDVCIYGFAKENKSLAIVEIVNLLSDTVAAIKFLKVIVDDTGNGLFDYLLKSGKTMNASLKYLKNITPCSYGERNEK